MRCTAGRVVVDFAELTDPGLDPGKQVNEDSSAFQSSEDGHLAVVCDGMGGHSGGREASQTAVRTIIERFAATPDSTQTFDALRGAIEAAGAAVFELGGTAPTESRPGATCVAAFITEPGVLIAHVGDSRALLVRGEGLYPLTRDHSMVQQLVDAGVLTPEAAANHPDANKITRALGMTPTVEVELAPTWQPVRAGDVLMLMTDGVSDLVEPNELRDIARHKIALGPAVVCQEVVELAKARGGHDNITLQTIHIIDAPAREDRATLDTDPNAHPLHPTQLLGTTQWSNAPNAPPTIVDDDDSEPQRTTEPNLSPPAFEPSSTEPRTPPDLTAPLSSAAAPLPPPPRPPPRRVPTQSPHSTIRAGLFVAVGLALLVALTAALALFVKFMRGGSEDAPPPPVTTTGSPTPPASETRLVADSDPPPAAPPPPSGAASAASPLVGGSATAPDSGDDAPLGSAGPSRGRVEEVPLPRPGGSAEP